MKFILFFSFFQFAIAQADCPAEKAAFLNNFQRLIDAKMVTSEHVTVVKAAAETLFKDAQDCSNTESIQTLLYETGVSLSDSRISTANVLSLVSKRESKACLAEAHKLTGAEIVVHRVEQTIEADGRRKTVIPYNGQNGDIILGFGEMTIFESPTTDGNGSRIFLYDSCSFKKLH